MLQRLRFVSSITLLYIFTIGTIGGILYSSHLFGTPVWAKPARPIIHKEPAPLPPKVIAGKPTRIVIMGAGIDLPVDDGVYNPADGSWTLSDNHAQFATMTAPANNHAGMTFVYGHGTDAVFGKIGSNRPAAGTSAELHTDNGHVFTYVLAEIQDLTPNDTSILDDTASGPPRLVIQTCTGAFSEWRTMFAFAFEKVTQ